MQVTVPKHPNGGCREEGTALQIHSPGLQCAGKPQGPPHGLGSPVSISLPPRDGRGDRQEENNSSGIHTQLSMEFKGKEKQLLQAATQPGTQRSRRDPSLGHELSQPHCKNSAEEIPKEE